MSFLCILLGFKEGHLLGSAPIQTSKLRLQIFIWVKEDSWDAANARTVKGPHRTIETVQSIPRVLTAHPVLVDKLYIFT